MKSALAGLGGDLKKGLSPRSWVRQFPWASIGLGAAAGIAAGFFASSSRPDRRVRHSPRRPGDGAGTFFSSIYGRKPRPALARRHRKPAFAALIVPALVHAARTVVSRAVVSSLAPRPARIGKESLPPDRGVRPFDIGRRVRGPAPPGQTEPSGRKSSDPGRHAKPRGIRRWWKIIRVTFSEWSKDNCFQLAAALSYYTVFSLAPLLIIVIAVAGLVFGREAVSEGVLDQMRGLIGEKGAAGVQGMLEGASQEESEGIIATVLGIGALILGATGVFIQLKDSLNTIWEVKAKPEGGFWRFVRDRILTFTIVLGIGFLLLVSLVLSAALAALGKYVESLLPLPSVVLHALNILVSVGVITVLFAMIYKLLPDVKLAWKHVWIGAAVTSVLFTIGKTLIGIYLGQTAVASTFGAAGAVVLVLLWTYYSALVFLLGAEFTQVHARETSPELVGTEDAVPVTEEARAQEGLTRR